MPELLKVEEPIKKAFVSKPTPNSERIEQEEKELEELISKEEESESEEGQEAGTPEEKTFKKRYGDLRRHSQKQREDYENTVAALKTQLAAATNKQIKLPKSEEELSEWAQQYPDVAAIVETIALKKSKEQSQDLEERVQKINELQESANRDKAEAQLMNLHPDFDEIRSDDSFHNWAEEQPKWVQDALYENLDDAKSVARVIDLYKTDKGITTKVKKNNSSDKAAAASVKTKGSSIPDTDDASKYIRESEVEAMHIKEYERKQEEILDAQRNGRFIYDISRK